MPVAADLHLHSTASDGSLSPERLACAAAAVRLSAVALTDHDTVSGWPEFSHKAQSLGLTALCGVEISCQDGVEPVHLLGYGFDPGHPALVNLLERMIAGRETRNASMLEKLDTLGLPLSEAAVRSYAGGTCIGRPHLAKAMHQAGYVSSPSEAFERWLGRGCPAYVERYRPEVPEAIRILRQAGGATALAHPFCLEAFRQNEGRALLLRLKDCGLDAVEAVYSGHTRTQENQLRALAGDAGLYVVGGSDFHDYSNTATRLGSVRLENTLFNALCALIASRRKT